MRWKIPPRERSKEGMEINSVILCTARYPPESVEHVLGSNALLSPQYSGCVLLISYSLHVYK